MARFIFLLFSIILILALYLGVLPVIAPALIRYFSLPVIFISFVALAGSLSGALCSAVILGLVLDLYSPFSFGLYSLVFLLSVLAIRFFISNFFQHKNFTSLLLANLLSLLICQLCFLLNNFFVASQNILSTSRLLIFFWQILIHSLVISAVYFFPNPLRRQLKDPAIT